MKNVIKCAQILAITEQSGYNHLWYALFGRNRYETIDGTGKQGA